MRATRSEANKQVFPNFQWFDCAYSLLRCQNVVIFVPMSDR